MQGRADSASDHSSAVRPSGCSGSHSWHMEHGRPAHRARGRRRVRAGREGHGVGAGLGAGVSARGCGDCSWL